MRLNRNSRKTHPADAADQETQHVRRVAVVEALARRVAQREAAQRGEPGVRSHIAGQHVAQRPLVGVGDRPDRGEAVGKARAVGHQVLDRDVARRGIGVLDWTLCVLQHLHAGELGHPLSDRVVQPELAFLHQHQRRGGGDRLGHRGDAEERVARHWRAAGDVALAQRVELQFLALAPDQRHKAREVARVDHRLQRRWDLRQSRLVDALQRAGFTIHLRSLRV